MVGQLGAIDLLKGFDTCNTTLICHKSLKRLGLPSQIPEVLLCDSPPAITPQVLISGKIIL